MEEDLGTGSVTIVLDDSGTAASLDRIEDRIERGLARAARDGARRIQRELNRTIREIDPLRVTIEADLRRFGRSVDGLNRLEPITIEVLPQVNPPRFIRQIERQLRGYAVLVDVEPNLDRFDRAIRNHRPPTVQLRIENRAVARAVQGLGLALGGLARTALGAAAAVGAVSVAVGALGGAVAGVVGAGLLAQDLASLAGAAAALPAVFSAAAVAIGTLRFATAGLGEAFGSALTDNAEDFEKALEGLTPAARSAARELRKLQPAFTRFREDVQGAFLEPFTGQIDDLARGFAPLRDNVVRLSGAFGDLALSFARALTQESSISNLSTAFDKVTDAVRGLDRLAGPLVDVFSQMSEAVLDAFGPRTSGAIDAAADSLARFAESGEAGEKAVSAVRGFLDTFRELSGIASNVRGIFTGIFSAGTAESNGLLDNIERITGAINEFVNSDAGQTAFSGLFQNAMAIAQQVGPIIQEIITQLGALDLTGLFETIGPAIQQIIAAIGPAIQEMLPGFITFMQELATVVGDMVDSGALQEIGAALGQMFINLAPILPPLGELITMILTGLAPAIEKLSEVLGPLLTALLEFVNIVIEGWGLLIAKFTEWFGQLDTFFNNLADTVEETVNGWTTAVREFVLGMVTDVTATVTGWVEEVKGFFTDLKDGITTRVTETMTAVTALFQELLATGTRIASSLVSSVTNFFSGLPGKVRGAISSLPGVLTSVFTSAWNALLRNVSSNMQTVTNFIGRLPSMVRSALGNIGGALYGAGQDLIFGLINGILSVAGQVASRARGVVEGAISAAKSALRIGSPSRVFHQFGVWTGEGYENGLAQMAGSVARQARDLAGAAVNGFGQPVLSGAVSGFQGIAQPFGYSATGAYGIGAQAGAQAPSRAPAPQRSAPGITANFTIHEVSSEATAQQVLNRLSVLAGL